MNTRSQTKREKSPMFDVIIDFDDASTAWKSNKRSIGQGSYTYICDRRGKNNNYCISKCLPGENYCKTHLKMYKEGKFTNCADYDKR
jgi:hypothetical protein